MSVDKALVNQPVAATDSNLDMWLLDQTKFRLIGTRVDGNITTSDYVYADGSPTFRITLKVTTQVDSPKSVFPLRRTTLKLYVPQTWTDSENGVVSAGPVTEWWTGFAVPADESVPVASQSKWLQSVLGLYYPSITAGVGSTDTLTELAFRYTDIF